MFWIANFFNQSFHYAFIQLFSQGYLIECSHYQLHAPFCWLVQDGTLVMLLWKETPSNEQKGFFSGLEVLRILFEREIIQDKTMITVKDTTRGIVFSVVSSIFNLLPIQRFWISSYACFCQDTWRMPIANPFFWLWLEERCRYTHMYTLCLCRASGYSFYLIMDSCSNLL